MLAHTYAMISHIEGKGWQVEQLKNKLTLYGNNYLRLPKFFTNFNRDKPNIMAAYGTYTDQELTALLKGGDERAYTEIYTRYWPLLFRHSLKMLHDEDQAMDVVQDIFTSLWFNRDVLDFNT
jgi:hypothetical protein